MLAALWPNSISPALKSSVTRLSNWAMHVRTYLADVELVTLTLHRLLAHNPPVARFYLWQLLPQALWVYKTSKAT